LTRFALNPIYRRMKKITADPPASTETATTGDTTTAGPLPGSSVIVPPQEWPWHPSPVVSSPPQGLLNISRGKTVQYVDFGFTSAREYWAEVVLPAYECFKSDPCRGKAIIASFPAWHIQDWIWHERHPGEDTRNSNKDYTQFQENLFNDCLELTWIRDVADAGKHRGLGRSTLEVREVRRTFPLNTTPLNIKLYNGTEHDFADVLSRVIEYWGTKYFP
jgi:hypothetical protein